MTDLFDKRIEQTFYFVERYKADAFRKLIDDIFTLKGRSKDGKLEESKPYLDIEIVEPANIVIKGLTDFEYKNLMLIHKAFLAGIELGAKIDY